VADVFAKCRAYTDVEAATVAGVYPYYRRIEEWYGAAEVRVDGRRVVMAGSNDYLGLARHPRVVAAAAEAVRRYGATCSGSRLQNGTLDLHERLEERLAAFLGRPAAVVLTTGFQTNLALAALFGRGDAVFADRENHASLVDAVRLGGATHRRYPHGGLAQLDRMLAAAGPDTGRVILTDGVFSADGGVCDLPGLVALARTHDARLFVDSGHDVGLLGKRGRGVAEHFGLEEAVDLVTVTLSKSFGSLGGAIAGPAAVIRYLRHHARSLLFAAALPPANAAAALTALDVIEAEPERRDRVLAAAARLRAGLREAGFAVAGSPSAIVPIHLSDRELCLRFWTDLLGEGVFGNAMVTPGVPPGGDLVRLSVTADHTATHVARIVAACATVAHRLGVLPLTRHRRDRSKGRAPS